MDRGMLHTREGDVSRRLAPVSSLLRAWLTCGWLRPVWLVPPALLGLNLSCTDSPRESNSLGLSPDAASVSSGNGSAVTSAPADAATPDPADPSAAVLGSADAGPFGFRRDVYPIFVEYCGQCHSVNGPYHDIASPDLAEAYADAVEFADRVVARIAQGNMPPGCVFDDAACVPAEDLLVIERWIAEAVPP